VYPSLTSVFLNRVYYRIKPFLPWGLRMALRRWLAARIRTACKDVWPINPAAGATPIYWQGWPERKQFAFVLTHDVEGPKGLDRSRALAELDRSLGFRSAFNFVPEGEYITPLELRRWLRANEFEVGLHDLRHDGLLYDSRASFRSHAKKINQYLKDWEAVGFRSGFMHHNLEWLQALNVAYDGSSFDTDPFEPQPDAVNTIFPFIYQGRSDRPPYVEMPSTLPQDFTLYILLQEKGIDLWKRKLDWIVERGGMALLNVHPDYVCLEGTPGRSEYPVKYYVEFLEYARSKYSDVWWQALPVQVAQHVAKNKATPVDGVASAMASSSHHSVHTR
jgi:hypothetical protein